MSTPQPQGVDHIHHRHAPLSIQHPAFYQYNTNTLTEDAFNSGGRYGSSANLLSTPSLLPPPVAFGGSPSFTHTQQSRVQGGSGGGLAASTQSMHFRGGSNSSGSREASHGAYDFVALSKQKGRPLMSIRGTGGDGEALPIENKKRYLFRALKKHMLAWFATWIAWLIYGATFGEETSTMMFCIFYSLFVTFPGKKIAGSESFSDPLPYRVVALLACRHGATMVVLLLEYAVQLDDLIPRVSDDQFTPFQTVFIASLIAQIYFAGRCAWGLIRLVLSPLFAWGLRVMLSGMGYIIYKGIVALTASGVSPVSAVGDQGKLLKGSGDGTTQAAARRLPKFLERLNVASLSQCKFPTSEDITNELYDVFSSVGLSSSQGLDPGRALESPTTRSVPHQARYGRVVYRVYTLGASCLKRVMSTLLAPVTCPYHRRKRSLKSSSMPNVNTTITNSPMVATPSFENVGHNRHHRKQFSATDVFRMSVHDLRETSASASSIPAFSPVSPMQSSMGLAPNQLSTSGGGGGSNGKPSGGCCVDCTSHILKKKLLSVSLVRWVLARLF